MTTYTITLTDAQTKSLEYAAVSIQDLIDNFVNDRARIAKDEIISLNTDYCNKNGIAIAVGEDAQVTQAYELGNIQTAYQRTRELELEVQKEIDALKAKKSKTDLKLKFR